MKTSLHFLLFFIVSFTTNLSAQTNKLSGKVLDNNNEPLVAATVRVDSLNNVAVTDINGEFIIELPKNTTPKNLIISYIGYETKHVIIGDQKNFNIILSSDETNLDEIIVIGYGNKRRQVLTTAVSDISTEILNDRNLSNAASALQGASPGLNISTTSGQEDDSPRINIRGFTSINGGSPLILIDGIEGNLNTINPSDIEKISILKDAGAAAIYGARGAFGVVLIETKQPNNKLSVNFSTSYSSISPTNNTDFLKDPYKAVQLVDDSFRNAVGRNYTGYNDEDYAALKEVSEDPSKSRVIISNRNGKDQYIHYGATDWWDYFWSSTRPSLINDISVSNGSGNLSAFLSYRNYKSDGFLKVQDDTYDKDNFRAKLSFDLTDWITLSNNTQYFKSKNIEHGGSQYGYRETWSGNMLVHALPSYIPTNPDGTSLWRTELNNYTVGDGVFASLLQGKSIQDIQRDEFSTLTELVVEPIENLKVTGNYAIRKSKFDRFQRSTKIPYSIYVGTVENFGENKLEEFHSTGDYNAFNLFGNYSRKINNHSLGLTFGFNQESYTYSRILSNKMDLISDDLNNLGLGSTNPESTGSAYDWALRGYLYRLSYDFKNKYILELNGRYDASSKFPKDYRWGFFPSISAGWNIANEDFIYDYVPEISLLKIRGSYGSLGNQNIGPYDYIPVLKKGTNNNFALDGSKLDYISSPDLNPIDITWETVKTLNLGSDVGLFDDKLVVNVDWFERNIEGMLTKGKTLPAVLGTGAPKENSADLKTKGFELAIGFNKGTKLLKKDLNYFINASLANSKSKITNFDNPKQSLIDYYEGMELGEIWGYHSQGLFQTTEEIDNHANQRQVSNLIYSNGGLQPGDIKYEDINGDGMVNEGEFTVKNPGDMKILGNSSPQFLYSARLGFDWNKFDFSAFLQGVGKQDWYPHRDERMFWAMYNRPYNSFIRKDLAYDIWTPEQPNAYFPRLVGYSALGTNRQLGVVNDRYLQDISYLRIKNLTLGYSFNINTIKKLGINQLRVMTTGENLFTFTKLTDYIDPEAASQAIDFNSPWTGNDRGKSQTYPLSKSYSFGLQLKF